MCLGITVRNSVSTLGRQQGRVQRVAGEEECVGGEMILVVRAVECVPGYKGSGSISLLSAVNDHS